MENLRGTCRGGKKVLGGYVVRGTYAGIRKQGTLRKEAMKLVAKDRGMSKRDVYQALLKEE